MTPRTPLRKGPRSVPAAGPQLVPCLMLRAGRVVVPGEGGPVVARRSDGKPYDVFDVLDGLKPSYARLYVADLDAVERDRPQLDYLQEIARDADVWLDAGVRSADQAIDALVTGASRAVITSSLVTGPRVLSRAWKLSQDIVFELELRDGRVDATSAEWTELPPAEVAASIRSIGIPEIIVSFREGSVDWELVRRIALGGVTWVGGTFDRGQISALARAGALGGIFHLSEETLAAWVPAPTPSVSVESKPPGRRDDETKNRLSA